MTHVSLLYESVKEILLSEWDPIGIHDIEKAVDEYDKYVGPLVTLILQHRSMMELRDYLIAVETDSMDLTANKERAELVGARLAALAPGITTDR
ncbi:MAG TPA: hypothetical protein VFA23_10790 [Dongiaceae bacterium]|jgi:hypothetical protein|nr:hypothetical protein [Dongiaceae bacterium]